MKSVRFAVLSLIILSFFIVLGCGNSQNLEFKTPYQVIFLDNNNTYIGKIQENGKDFIRINTVYYIVTQMNQETKQVSNTLTKRGNELHKPDFMFINKRHIIMIESVTPDSQIAKLIEQSETQNKIKG